jgi:hypothetical protein
MTVFGYLYPDRNNGNEIEWKPRELLDHAIKKIMPRY